MVIYLTGFVVLWLVAGLLTLLIKFLNRLIMHDHSLAFTEDIVLDDNGEKKVVDRGSMVYVEMVGSGLFGCWIAFGALSMALSEYSTGTNFPGKKRFSFWRGDHKRFLIAGPFALLLILPKAAARYFGFVS